MGEPRLLQVLPTGVGPEGVKAIPGRDLLAVSAEVDDRDAKIRSSITLYELSAGAATYPTVLSGNRDDGLPIPWGALSALAPDLGTSRRAYTVYDSFYDESRIFELFLGRGPALITDEIVLGDGGETLNLDPEGLATRQAGGFWVASEGAGSVDDENRPVTSLNLLYRVAPDGTVEEVVELPDSVNALQRRFGFEGVASVSDDDDDDDDDRGGLEFAVIERDNQGGPDARIKRIYRFSWTASGPGARRRGTSRWSRRSRSSARSLRHDPARGPRPPGAGPARAPGGARYASARRRARSRTRSRSSASRRAKISSTSLASLRASLPLAGVASGAGALPGSGEASSAASSGASVSPCAAARRHVSRSSSRRDEAERSREAKVRGGASASELPRPRVVSRSVS